MNWLPFQSAKARHTPFVQAIHPTGTIAATNWKVNARSVKTRNASVIDARSRPAATRAKTAMRPTSTAVAAAVAVHLVVAVFEIETV